MDTQDSSWLLREFRHIGLEDPRLLKRFFITAELLSANPLDCIHKACGKWAAVKGAYRLFGNEKLCAKDIFGCHQHETLLRAKDHEIIFAIQDTCFLDYESHPKTTGLGSISKGYGKKDKPGLIVHATYAVTLSAFPLGLLTWNCWARSAKPKLSRYERTLNDYQRESKEKESYKWIDAFQQANELLPKSAKVVTLADREADIFELMHEHISTGRSFVIRNRFNRRVEKSKYKDDPKMRDILAKKKENGFIDIQLPAKPGRKARQAKLAIRYCEITTPIRSNLKGGALKNREGLPPTLTFNVIHAAEVSAPKGEETIDWYLLTNEPVTNLDEAIEKINWYKLRWQIETFFRVLKSGCRIEATRLTDAQRLQKYNALMAAVAWRICFITHMARVEPEQRCTKILSNDQWQALYCRSKNTWRLPKKPPSVFQAVTWIAQLGGFLNRKSDGFPGPMALWRGWQVLEEVLPMYVAMKSKPP